MQKIRVKYTILTSCAALIIALFITSCSSNEATITGRFIGGDSTTAYLEEISNDQRVIIDSVALDANGDFSFTVKGRDEHHKLFNVVYDWSTIPLFVAAGDRININSVGNIAKNYTVEGSAESDKVRTFYQSYIGGIAALDAIAIKYGSEGISEEERNDLAKEYTTEYTKIKRDQLAFIIENKSSLAAVYALYQRLPNDSYLFSGKNDVIYYRTVAEALEESYPDSPYRKSIQTDIDNFDALNRLTTNITERGYPDLEINDMYGVKQKLSDLEGNVILLDFWSAQIGSSNRNNAELKEIYAEFHERGFEIYQVAIDSSKSTWINSIQEQAIPWTTVSDLKGNRSITLSLYNITAIPSNFIISREGEIIARDVYGKDLLDIIKKEL